MTAPAVSSGQRPALRGTYRLQLRPDFGFDAAARVVPYLARLGVSHLYLSPVAEAVAGSTHGYDVVDPTRLRAELGGPDGFGRLAEEARSRGVGIVLDIVPHHVGAHRTNPWWWDVLARGEASRWAGWFDIDWPHPDPELRGRVLLPVLGDHYGRELEAGHLRLEREGAWLLVRYFEHAAPLDPVSTGELLEQAAAAGDDPLLGFAARALAALVAHDDVSQARALAGERLDANPRAAKALETLLADVADDHDRLDELLSRQHHRLARWAMADAELDYRRFFEIDTLVALRAEREEVFQATHELPLALLADGVVQGLRVDHIDGLRDPGQYTRRLRAAAGDAWLVVEKIRHVDEPLPEDWPVDGTTGYEMAGAVTGLMLQPEGQARLVAAWSELTGCTSSYDEMRADARREMAVGPLRSDVERVLTALAAVRHAHRRWRDFTRVELLAALVEVCMRMTVYRAYVVAGSPASDADRRRVLDALAQARSVRADLDPELFDLLGSLLLGEVAGPEAATFVARFQQLTGPLAAKGEEDTALYRFTPCLAACEVGMDPGDPCLDAERFHHWCRTVAERLPATMLTTSTHDTKRSEDVRARLALLTEDPEALLAGLDRWQGALRDAGAVLAQPADLWSLFQTLVGAWPIDADRLWTVVRKSLREAKVSTSWARPDTDYESVVEGCCRLSLTDPEAVRAVEDFVAPLVEPGRVNSLATVVLRLLCPGVPDTYQGTETWDLSLVDPDNRRPVDFEDLSSRLENVAGRLPAELWADPGARERGDPKLALVTALLRLRSEHPKCFEPRAGYEALATGGGGVVAFARDGAVLGLVPRFPLTIDPSDVSVHLPEGAWVNVCTGRGSAGGVTPFGAVRGDFPVAVLVRN